MAVIWPLDIWASHRGERGKERVNPKHEIGFDGPQVLGGLAGGSPGRMLESKLNYQAP